MQIFANIIAFIVSIVCMLVCLWALAEGGANATKLYPGIKQLVDASNSRGGQ